MKRTFVMLLTTLVVLPVSFGIWYIWFGPGIEIDPKFPRDPQGGFLQQPVVINTPDQIFVDWVVPSRCSNNEIEFQEADRAGQNDWMGGTADCVAAENEFACQVDLTNRALSEGIIYRLQAHNSECIDGQNYTSVVVIFTP